MSDVTPSQHRFFEMCCMLWVICLVATSTLRNVLHVAGHMFGRGIYFTECTACCRSYVWSRHLLHGMYCMLQVICLVAASTSPTPSPRAPATATTGVTTPTPSSCSSVRSATAQAHASVRHASRSRESVTRVGHASPSCESVMRVRHASQSRCPVTYKSCISFTTTANK